MRERGLEKAFQVRISFVRKAVNQQGPDLVEKAAESNCQEVPAAAFPQQIGSVHSGLESGRLARGSRKNSARCHHTGDSPLPAVDPETGTPWGRIRRPAASARKRPVTLSLRAAASMQAAPRRQGPGPQPRSAARTFPSAPGPTALPTRRRLLLAANHSRVGCLRTTLAHDPVGRQLGLGSSGDFFRPPWVSHKVSWWLPPRSLTQVRGFVLSARSLVSRWLSPASSQGGTVASSWRPALELTACLLRFP